MTFLETILLALALSVDSLVVSTSSVLKSRMSLSKGVQMAVIFAFFQGFFPLLGALLGIAFKDLVETMDHWVAFFLLLLVGAKMIWDAFHEGEEERPLDVTRLGIMCLLGVATSIDAFVVGIGFGLNSTMARILLTVIVIGVVTFVASMLGYLLGKRGISMPERWASVLAGLVLIGLGTYTLCEHLLL